MVDLVVSLVLVALACILIGRRVYGWWRARRARRDSEAWQREFDERGGSRPVYRGYDQVKAVEAKRADRAKFRRRYRRVKSTKPADVVTFRLKGSR